MAERLDKLGLSRLWRAVLIKILSSVSENITDLNTQIQIDLNSKVDKVEGKSLSTNDYTTSEKDKLASIGNATSTDLGLVMLQGVDELDVGHVTAATPSLIEPTIFHTKDNYYVNLDDEFQYNRHSYVLTASPSIVVRGPSDITGPYNNNDVVLISQICSLDSEGGSSGSGLFIVIQIFTFVGSNTAESRKYMRKITNDLAQPGNYNVTNWKEIMPAATGILF